MISTLIYIWYLLTAPSDRFICAMWVSKPPTPANLAAACGALSNAKSLIWRAVDINTGQIGCSGPASELPYLSCPFGPIDHYRIEVIWPAFQSVVCTISMDSFVTPDANTIAQQCPRQKADYVAGNLVLAYQGARPPTPPPAPFCPVKNLDSGQGFYDMPGSAAVLQTSKPYYLLAGNLIWHGLAKPNCNGLSGVDPDNHAATECGLATTMPDVIHWQNQFDQAIYNAASQKQVPPRLLKGVIAQESQFWPLAVGPQGESGLIQLTDAGADIVLQYSPNVYARVCSAVLSSLTCNSSTYDLLDQNSQALLRSYLVTMLQSPADLAEAVTSMKSSMWLDMDILRAYYCYTGEITGTPSWETTLAVYHAGSACVASGKICQQGQDYIEKVQALGQP
ncbi:MAG TPA: transglycosylase SLT domain-containing protein [Anaerolineales bacterium]|nr:transglycosylase SLT domain-containing protein [Anaerolineales bacterium]